MNLVQALQEANEWQEEQDATIEQLRHEVDHLTTDAGAAIRIASNVYNLEHLGGNSLVSITILH